MKIILLKDILKIGRKYEIKNVSDGFAFNSLIPKGLAEVATASAVKRAEKMKSEDTTHKKVQEDLLLMNIKAIDGMTLEISERANEKGHLFAGIHKEEIIAKVREKKSIDLLPEFIMLKRPIKEVGEFEIEIKAQDKKAKLKLVVTGIKF